jgi:hypothetical protein
MSVRRSSIVLGTTGVVLIALAIVLRFVLVPILTKLPTNTDLGIQYSGTGTLLNAQALQSGDTAHVLAANVPITVDRRVKVTGANGSTAIVSDNLTINAGGQKLPSDHTYALDRTTQAGARPIDAAAVEPSLGALSSTFPIGPKPDDSYRFYDSTTRTIVPLRYAGSGSLDGRSVNTYKVDATGPVRDAGLLKLLPQALPKNLLAGLAPLLPADVRAKVTPAMLAALPDPVPLGYTGVTHIDAWVDRQTGVPVNEHINEQVLVDVSLGAQSLSLTPVLALDFQISPDSQKYLADQATSHGHLLTIIKVIVPIVLVVLGILLVAVAIVRQVRRR